MQTDLISASLISRVTQLQAVQMKCEFNGAVYLKLFVTKCEEISSLKSTMERMV